MLQIGAGERSPPGYLQHHSLEMLQITRNVLQEILDLWRIETVLLQVKGSGFPENVIVLQINGSVMPVTRVFLQVIRIVLQVGADWHQKIEEVLPVLPSRARRKDWRTARDETGSEI